MSNGHRHGKPSKQHVLSSLVLGLLGLRGQHIRSPGAEMLRARDVVAPLVKQKSSLKKLREDFAR
jgi:hypothetical protein